VREPSGQICGLGFRSTAISRTGGGPVGTGNEKSQDMRGCLIGGSVNGEELSSQKFYPFLGTGRAIASVRLYPPQGFLEAQKRLQGNGY